MNNIKEQLGQIFNNTIVIIVMLAYIGSLPLALIFGDKWDVVISLFIPTYGIWVMLGEIL
jgi:hypothetical protein